MFIAPKEIEKSRIPILQNSILFQLLQIWYIFKNEYLISMLFHCSLDLLVLLLKLSVFSGKIHYQVSEVLEAIVRCCFVPGEFG